MREFKQRLLVQTLLLSALASPIFAKNLESRFGAGFVNEFANSTSKVQVPAMSLKYGLTKDYQLQAMVGFNTADVGAATVGAKFIKNLFFENNLNFYAAAGLAYIKGEKQAFEVLALLGAEFFIPGIDSLGLSFETGVSVNNSTGTFSVKTVGFSFLHAGMHFYF